MKPIKLLSFITILTFAFSIACNTPEKAENNTPKVAKANQNAPGKKSSEAVTFTADKVSIKQGATAEAIVKLNIGKEFHINANPPSEENLIPTEIKLDAKDGISAEKPLYPKGELKSFAFSPNKKLAVYEGEVEIKIPLKAEKNAAKGEKSIGGKLRVQPCDDEVCYPPKSMDITIAVTVE